MPNVNDLQYKDLEIIEEVPLRVRIGRRSLIIRPLPLRRADEFELKLFRLLANWGNLIGAFNLLNVESFENDEIRKQVSDAWVEALRRNDVFLVDVIKVICKPYRFSWRYFRRHATYQDVIQTLLASYLQNYEAVKKNLSYLLRKAHLTQLSPTSLTSSSENTDGPKSGRLTPRY